MTKWDLAILVRERGYDTITALEEITEAIRRGPGTYSIGGLIFKVEPRKG